MELEKLNKHEISHEEIQKLFPKINNGRKWHVDVNTYQFIDAIIDEWFEERGIDFWNKPEISSYELTGEPIKIIFYTL